MSFWQGCNVCSAWGRHNFGSLQTMACKSGTNLMNVCCLPFPPSIFQTHSRAHISPVQFSNDGENNAFSLSPWSQWSPGQLNSSEWLIALSILAPRWMERYRWSGVTSCPPSLLIKLIRFGWTWSLGGLLESRDSCGRVKGREAGPGHELLDPYSSPSMAMLSDVILGLGPAGSVPIPSAWPPPDQQQLLLNCAPSCSFHSPEWLSGSCCRVIFLLYGYSEHVHHPKVHLFSTDILVLMSDMHETTAIWRLI